MPKPICKDIKGIKPVSTRHSVGMKRVLTSLSETDSPITQIAKTMLKAGDIVESHVHSTMDEHFIILNGKCQIVVDGVSYECGKDLYLYIPEKSNHSINVIKDTEMIIISVAKQ